MEIPEKNNRWQAVDMEQYKETYCDILSRVLTIVGAGVHVGMSTGLICSVLAKSIEHASEEQKDLLKDKLPVLLTQFGLHLLRVDDELKERCLESPATQKTIAAFEALSLVDQVEKLAEEDLTLEHVSALLTKLMGIKANHDQATSEQSDIKPPPPPKMDFHKPAPRCNTPTTPETDETDNEEGFGV